MLAPRAGAQLGHYELVRAIGSGGMGIVYEAKHTTLGRRVAIKVLHAHEAGIPKSNLLAKRFLREGRAAAAVKHAHVVDVFDFGVHEGTPFLVMELLDGETLAQRIERGGAMRVEEAVELLLPVVSAVAELHAAGIIHRDLKPANILLARDRSGAICPKVGDFGVSRLDDGSAGLTESGVVVGTCAYMSPEQALASKGVVAHSDQYALGAILYECTTGKLPFEGETAYALTHAILNAPLAPPSAKNAALPRRFDALVLRAMAREAEARFGSIEELGEALLSFAAPEVEARWAAEFRPASTKTTLPSVAPVSASPIEAPLPVKRRSRARIGTAAVVASLLAAGVVVWSSRAPVRRADDGASSPLIARFPAYDSAHAPAVSPAQPAPLPATPTVLAVEDSASVASAVPASPPPRPRRRSPRARVRKRREGPPGRLGPNHRRPTTERRFSTRNEIVAKPRSPVARSRPPRQRPPGASQRGRRPRRARASGVALRREHRTEEALALFAKAVAISPSPNARAQLALAEQALARWLDAERDLDAALAANSEWIEKNRASLEGARAVVRQHLGWLTVNTDVAAAHAQLDGRPIPRSLGTRVVAGPSVLEVRAAGYAPDIRRLEVRADEHVHTTISLEPLVAAPAPPVREPVPTVPKDAPPPAVTAPATPPPERPHAERSPRPRPIPVVPIALGVAGLAGIVTGTYFGIRTFQDKSDRATDCIGGCTPAATTAFNDGVTSSIASDVGFGVGLALLAGGAVWWLVGRASPPGAKGALEIGPVVGAQMSGIVVRGNL